MVKKWRSITFILPLALIGVGFFVNSASAEDAVFRAVVDEYLSLELDNTHMEVNVLPNMPFASGYVTATVNTNAAAGYTLTFQDTDSRNGLEREGYDEATDKSPFNIPSVSADTTYASLAADSWGYYLGSTTDTEATYKQIPLSATEIKTTDAPAADDASRVSFGVKISTDRPSGLYEDELTFTAVANIVDPDPNTTTFDEAYAAAKKPKDVTSDKYKLQDMTPEICSAVTIEQTTTLVDTRDNTTYQVGKLVDGRCWLLDNLALDPVTNGSNLTPRNTNATQDAIDNYISGGNVKGYNGWSTNAVSRETTTSVYDQPQINAESKDLTRSSFTNPTDPLIEANDWKFGIYYNYCAASVSTYCFDETSGVDMDPDSVLDVKNDICPAGWRMPTGATTPTSSGETGSGEYGDLVKAITGATKSSISGEPYYSVFRKTLRLPLSGSIMNGYIGSQGYYGEYWASTDHSASRAYRMYAYYNLYINASDSALRLAGLSVRCIAKGAQE